MRTNRRPIAIIRRSCSDSSLAASQRMEFSEATGRSLALRQTGSVATAITSPAKNALTQKNARISSALVMVFPLFELAKVTVARRRRSCNDLSITGQSAARAFPYWRQERSSASRMLFGVDTCEPWCLQFAWVLLRRVGPEPMAIEKRIHAWHRSSEESRPFLKWLG